MRRVARARISGVFWRLSLLDTDGFARQGGLKKSGVVGIIAGSDMFGKFIILTIAILLIGAFLRKLATRVGLLQPKPPHATPARQVGITGFRLTKFNIAMLGLVALYLLWGATQILR